MILPRANTDQSNQIAATPIPSAPPSAPDQTSYNTITGVIVGAAAVAVLVCFYMLYWRKRPSPHSESIPRRSISGAARSRAHGPDRWWTIERKQRGQETRNQCDPDQDVRRVKEEPREGVDLPKYSKSLEAEEVHRNGLDIASVQAQAVICVPPPAYDRGVAISSGRTYSERITRIPG